MRMNYYICNHMDESYKLNAEQSSQTQNSTHCVIVFRESSKLDKAY